MLKRLDLEWERWLNHRREMNVSPKINSSNRSASLYCGNIVAFGRENIETAIYQRVRAKFRSMLAKTGVYGCFLINRRINQIVSRKMKKLVSPYALFASR